MTSSPALGGRPSGPIGRWLWRGLTASLLFASWAASLPAQTGENTFYEFGRIVALGQHSVEVQTFDKQKRHLVQHGFTFNKATHADPVHVGDAIEAIYSFDPGGERALRRLIALPHGLPADEEPAEGALRQGSPAPAPRTSAGREAVAPSQRAAVTDAPLVLADRNAAHKAVPTPSAVDLSGPAKAPPPPVRPLSLGEPGPASSKPAPKVKEVRQETPNEECHRSDPAWPSDPLRLLVIDFRYPTEREEAHDVGTTGGGSGTAVADLVFGRMEKLEQNVPRFAFARGDRRRLDRTDFAGAARMGRELGADAVLAGTFFPVETPARNPDDPPVTHYELRAGLVDSCTGELLLRLSSVACPAAISPGIDPGMSSPGMAPCQRFAVTSAEAADPKRFAESFRPVLNSLLYPLEHDGAPRYVDGVLEEGSAGIVTQAQGRQLTVRLPANVHLKPGDQVGIHARRLAKNPTTYTLHELHDEEIGRFVLSHITGRLATGTFTGDFDPLPGDTAELLQPE